MIIFIEVVVWLLMNRINILRVPIYFNVNRLDPESDILFDFSKTISNAHEPSKSAILIYSGMKIIHLTHYFQNPDLLAKRIANLDKVAFCAEANLANSDFFKKYFPECNEVYILPFVAKEKFKIQSSTAERKRKCLAIGSIGRLKSDAVRNYFPGIKAIQPMRLELLESSHLYAEFVECKIRGSNDTDISHNMNIELTNYFLIKRRIGNLLHSLRDNRNENAYFKFDLAKEFEKYSMFVAPEEVTGLPSINFVEGMMTGCIYLGANEQIYSDYGMVKNEHYILYEECNIRSLIDGIARVNSEKELRELVSINGKNFAERYFSGEFVSKTFAHDISNVSCSEKSKWLNFNCSFVKRRD
jgi:hypothetical protein